MVNRVTLDCEVDGEIANRCLEFSALDRVIYNLVNNAARYSVDHAIELSIFSPVAPNGPSVRFVLQNKITPDQAARIEQLSAMGVDGIITNDPHLFPPERPGPVS